MSRLSVALVCGFVLSLLLVEVASFGQTTGTYCKDKTQCTGTDVLCKGCIDQPATGDPTPNPAQQVEYKGGTDCDMTGTTQSTKTCKTDGTKTDCTEKRTCELGGIQSSAICPSQGNACETGHSGKKCRVIVLGVATYDKKDNKKCQ